jgi:translation initiation factor IF-1
MGGDLDWSGGNCITTAALASARTTKSSWFLGLMVAAACVKHAACRNQVALSARSASNPLMPARSRNQGKRGSGRKRSPYGPPKKSSKDGEDKAVEVEGEISAVLAGTMFRVRLQSGHEVLAHISGKMRKRFIRLVVGDRVKMEMSPYDLTKARIVFRLG